MDFHDLITLDGTHKTSDGFLIADVRVSRTGIQIYNGTEVGRPDMPKVRVFRPESEVFAKDALKTFARRPITLGHPDELVTSANVSDVMVGITDGEIARDGETVRVPMMLMDQAAIDAVEAGINQLSMGYTADLEFVDGTTPAGEPYDAIQRNLRMNHLAIVANARGGSALKIGDTKNGGRKMTDNTQKMMVDEVSVDVSDTAAQVIAKALKGRDKKIADAEKAQVTHAEAIAAKDKEIAKRDAEITELKGKALDDAALDAKVSARADLIAKARAIHKDVETDGKSDAEIRKAVVVAKLGDEAIKDKSDAYIDAHFDIMAEKVDESTGGPVRDALKGGLKVVDNDAWGTKIFDAAGVKMKKEA